MDQETKSLRAKERAFPKPDAPITNRHVLWDRSRWRRRERDPTLHLVSASEQQFNRSPGRFVIVDHDDAPPRLFSARHSRLHGLPEEL